MGAKKVTGWGYNAEAFDAVTGMINLRARQYEPTMNRFGQKNTKAKIKVADFSDNEYQYAKNNAQFWVDRDGKSVIALPLSDYLMQRAATWMPTVLRAAKAVAVGAFAYLTAKISTLWNKVFSPETHQQKLARESRLAEIRRQGPKPGVAPQQAACTPSISQGAMPSGPDSKAPDKEPRKKEHMEGEDGTQTTSKTVYNRNGFRIDVENPNPGQRP